MTVFEILNFNRELITKLYMMGIKPNDYRYLDLYSEYEALKKRGEKITYIVSSLSSKYTISERKVYDLIKRFGKHCTFGAS